jgi:hypothetical protein
MKRAHHPGDFWVGLAGPMARSSGATDQAQIDAAIEAAASS